MRLLGIFVNFRGPFENLCIGTLVSAFEYKDCVLHKKITFRVLFIFIDRERPTTLLENVWQRYLGEILRNFKKALLLNLTAETSVVDLSFSEVVGINSKSATLRKTRLHQDVFL